MKHNLEDTKLSTANGKQVFICLNCGEKMISDKSPCVPNRHSHSKIMSFKTRKNLKFIAYE